MTSGMILTPHTRSQTNSQINLETLDENKNSKENTIKILLDSVASASIVRKIVLKKCRRILKNRFGRN